METKHKSSPELYQVVQFERIYSRSFPGIAVLEYELALHANEALKLNLLEITWNLESQLT